MTFEEQCYVVYGKGIKPLKIKGLDNKNGLVEKLKQQGFKPKYSQLNSIIYSKICKTKPTSYI